MTIDAIQKIRFDLIYSFKYSPRPGTRAADYPGHLSESVKSERLKILLETQEKIVREKFQALVGTYQEVLIEGNHHRKANTLAGRTRGNHSVFIKNSTKKAGDLMSVLITKANQNSLEAEPSSAITSPSI